MDASFIRCSRFARLYLALIPLIACLWAASPARGGEVYAFTIEGRVLYQFIGGQDQPQADDPFTIRFIADSTDLEEPNSDAARFAVTDLSIAFPQITYDGVDPLQYMEVLLFGPSIDILSVRGRVRNPHDPLFPYTLSMGIIFPDGTLNDSFPASVPLSIALVADFETYIGFSVNLKGEIHSYQSVRIPEPTSFLLLTTACSFARRRKR